MTDRQFFIYDALTLKLDHYEWNEKCICLEDYYYHNIDIFEDAVLSGNIGNIGEIVDNDMDNLSYIQFGENEDICREKFEEINRANDDNLHLIDVSNRKFIYSLENNLKDFTKDMFIERTHDEEMEF